MGFGGRVQDRRQRRLRQILPRAQDRGRGRLVKPRGRDVSLGRLKKPFFSNFLRKKKQTKKRNFYRSASVVFVVSRLLPAFRVFKFLLKKNKTCFYRASLIFIVVLFLRRLALVSF